MSQQPSGVCLEICIKTNTAVERSLTCYAAAWSTQFSSHLKEDRRHNNKGKAEIRAIFLSTLLSRKMRLLKKLQSSTGPESHSQAKNFHRRESVSPSHQSLTSAFHTRHFIVCSTFNLRCRTGNAASFQGRPSLSIEFAIPIY